MSSQPNSPSNSGRIAGIAVGVVFGALVLMGLIFLSCWHRKNRRYLEDEDNDSNCSMQKSSSPRRSILRLGRPPMRKYTSLEGDTGTRSQWWEGLRPEEIGVAISTERPSYLRRLTGLIHKPQPPLPTSESAIKPPDMVLRKGSNKVVPRPSLATVANETSFGQVSITATVGTSTSRRTMRLRSASMARPYSITSSTATTFEEDLETPESELPPMPGFKTVQMSSKSRTTRRNRHRPAPLNIDTTHARYPTRKSSRVPVTPSYDNGNVVLPTQAPVSIRPQLDNITFPTPPQRVHLTSSIAVQPDMNPMSPWTPKTPQSPYAIPERQSSLQNLRTRMVTLAAAAHPYTNARNLNQYTPNRATPKTPLRPLPPLQITRSQPNDSSITASPIRNLQYPMIPTSASERSTTRTIPAASVPSSLTQRFTNTSHLTYDGLPNQTSPTPPPLFSHPHSRHLRTHIDTDTANRFDNDEEQTKASSDLNYTCSIKPSGPSCSPHPHPSASASSPSQCSQPNSMHQYHQESRYGFGQILDPNSVPPRATVTPNRLQSGDLVLTVDM